MWVSKCVKFLSRPPSSRPLQSRDTEFQQNIDINGSVDNSSEDQTAPTDGQPANNSNSDTAWRQATSPVLSQQDSSDESADSDENQRSCPSPSRMRLRLASERRAPKRFDIEMVEVLTPPSYKKP